MKLRTFVVFAVVAAFAATAFALSPEHVEFGKGPATFLMTKDETAKWKAVKTDEEAKAFIDLFWARRDPTPATPRNEFREQFDAKVEYANKNFDERGSKGAMTDRGKMLIFFGLPKRLEMSGAARGESVLTPGSVLGGTAPPAASGGDTRPERETINWIYEGEESTQMFQTPRAKISFVDRFNNRDFKMERGAVDVAAAQQRAIERFITQPNLTVAPTFAAAPEAAAPPAAAPAVAAAPVVTALTTEALQTAVTNFKGAAKNPFDKNVHVAWGEFVTADGKTFVPVSLYVPSSAGLTAAQSLTFFGVVEDASGKPVLAFEQPAKLVASKADYFVDKSLTLPGGKHRGIFGLAENGKVLAMASTDMELSGALDKDASTVSSVILSNNLYPLTEPQQATDPFAFGGVKVVPKADKAFRKTDDLWYFFELRNPGLAEPVPPQADPAVQTIPADPAPKIQVKMEVVGKESTGKDIKRGLPLREMPAIPMKGVPGHYGIGYAIPLASFEPGDYTFNVKVIDTVKKTSYNLSEKFKIIP